MSKLVDELDWSSPAATRYRVPVIWRKNLLRAGYTAKVRGDNWGLLLGDFPSEPLWTLAVNGREVARFSEWPPEWRKA